MTIIHLDDKNFEEEVNKSDIPVIIDFFADWCGPCKMMAPVFEELSEDYEGKLKFAKANTDEMSEIADKFEIRGIPCLVVVKGGKELERIVGFNPKEELKKKIDGILK